jgi:hypothetical protein
MVIANLEIQVNSNSSIGYGITHNPERVYDFVPAFLRLLKSQDTGDSHFDLSALGLDTWMQETADSLFTPNGYEKERISTQDPTHEVLILMERRLILYSCTPDRILANDLLQDEERARQFLHSIKPLKDNHGYDCLQIQVDID